MVTTIDDTKRTAIGQKLADMKAVQQLIISNEEKLVSAVNDSEIRKRMQHMLDDDQKNMGVLETVIVQYGIQTEPHQSTTQMIGHVQEMMENSDFSVFEKVAQHELLKHAQVGNGLIVHKCAQVVGADIEVAIAPLNAINFENRAHQEQLKGISEVLGTRELTGKDPDQGLWGRVQDAMAAITGVAGSVVTQGSSKSDMNIQTVIRLDHNKVNTLFTELLASNDPQKIQEYFGQIYKDLTVHAEAEEQVVYPRVRSFYGDNDTQELYDEQAQLKQMLEDIKSTSPSSSDFKDKIRRVMDVVGDHIRQEESTMFAAIDNNCSSEQKEQMASEFKAAKAKLQQEMASSK
jgi:hemerythrin superfamily protein